MGTKVTQGNFEEKKRRFEDDLGDDDDLQFSFKGEKEFARKGGVDSFDDIDDIQTTGKKLKGAPGGNRGMGGKNMQRNLEASEQDDSSE